MAGASLSIDVKYDDKQVVQALKRLQQAGGDMEAVFTHIGEHLIESTKGRFEAQEDPDGVAWEVNTDFTASRKKGDMILIESGNLMDQLHYNVSGDGLEFGSNSDYAAMHQFGGDTSPLSMIRNKPIPARPFLGINSEDEAEIIAIINDHYRSLIRTP